MAEFSERLRELRHKNGVTQKALGMVIVVGPDSISVYESGKGYPEVRRLIIIAEFFNVSLDYLVGRTDNPEINH